MIPLDEYSARVRELNPSVTVRDATLDDANAFVRLFNAQYKRSTSTEYFKWQFFDSVAPSRLFTAWDTNKLIGFYGIKILTLSGGEKAGFAVDLLIEESWRRRGIAYLLEAEVVRFSGLHHAVLIAALPNNFGNAAFKALGWKSVAKIDTLLWAPGPEPGEVTISPPSNKPLTKFKKSDDYIAWRFDQHPHYRYQKIKLDESNFAVTKFFEDTMKGTFYNDIVLVEGTEAQRRSLLARATNQLKLGGSGILTIWALTHTPSFAFLTKMGFAGMAQERYFCIKLLDMERADLLDIRNWDLDECDAEIF